MSEYTNNDASLSLDAAIDFGSKFTQSDLFSQIFQEGMGLVETTASYLDGPGRDESRHLNRNAAMAYATESMRLTTRLMQLASWLLLQRAVKDGEMTVQEAQDEKYRINLAESAVAARSETWKDLPETLVDLIARSQRLHERIVHLDEMLYRDAPQTPQGENPVSDQMSMLQAAFGKLGG